MLWGRVWSEFSNDRERDRTGAYLSLLRAITQHGAEFVPALIQPKDYADLVIHLESFIKQEQGTKHGGSAIELLQKFLGDNDLTMTTVEVIVPSDVVN